MLQSGRRTLEATVEQGTNSFASQKLYTEKEYQNEMWTLCLLNKLPVPQDAVGAMAESFASSEVVVPAPEDDNRTQSKLRSPSHGKNAD